MSLGEAPLGYVHTWEQSAHSALPGASRAQDPNPRRLQCPQIWPQLVPLPHFRPGPARGLLWSPLPQAHPLPAPPMVPPPPRPPGRARWASASLNTRSAAPGGPREGLQPARPRQRGDLALISEP